MNKAHSIKLTHLVLIAISVYSFVFTGYWKFWPDDETPFKSDNAISYWYVPATFIHHSYKVHQDENGAVYPDAQNRLIPKYTYGMSAMYTPFFFIGHKLAAIRGEPLKGYSRSYGQAVHYGCILYGLIGLAILGSILRRYFSDSVSAVTLLLVFFATNLMMYLVGESERVHTSLFFLFSLFTWLTIKWHEQRSWTKSFFVGLLAGLIAMVRPTDVIVVLVFILYGVHDWSSFKEKFSMFLQNKYHVILMLAAFVLVIFPQLLFWKQATGHWIYYGYGDEKFFWTQPKLIQMLFSYRNGWFLYTPVMLFAFIGLFLMKRYVRDMAFGSVAFILLNLYVLSCWWCWWFMGFGLRAVVQSYPIMALGLASFITALSRFEFRNSGWIAKYAVAILFCFFTCTNLAQSYQFRVWLLSGDGTSKKMFWKTFCKMSWSQKDMEEARAAFPKISWEEAIKGKR